VGFPANVYLLAVAAAIVTSALSLPIWRKWCVRTGLMDDPGARKIHALPIPLAGGFAVITGIILPIVGASLLLWGLMNPAYNASLQKLLPGHLFDQGSVALLVHGIEVRKIELAGILGGAVGMLAIGWLDDKHELKPFTKFAGQFIIAAMVAASGARITLFVHNAGFSYVVTIFWIIAVINAFNFMDNMNGLCAGLGAIGVWYLAIIAAGEGQYLVALIAFLTFGALLGFLPYNFPRARAFLGDAGSMSLGHVVFWSLLPASPDVRGEGAWAPYLWPMALPVLDTAAVIASRLFSGQSPLQADRLHIHHLLQDAGIGPRASLAILLAAAVSLFGVGRLVLPLACSYELLIWMGAFAACCLTRGWLRREAVRRGRLNQVKATACQHGKKP